MQSKRQPKVHTYSKKRRRKVRPGRAILSIGFTFLVAGVIGVVGYSVAKPILQYSGAEHSQTQPEETLSSAAAETAAPEESASAAVTETTAAPVQTQAEDGYVLPVSALESKQALQAAAASAREKMPDGKLLVIPLKVSGGEIWYQTSASLAKSCGAAKGSMTLSEIVDTVTQQGWTPAAQLSLLWDNLLPDADAAAGYRVTDGSRWLDNTKENGGKAWASPFSTVTVQYLTEITGEVSRAGFSQIWCKDAVVPGFPGIRSELHRRKRSESGAECGAGTAGKSAGTDCRQCTALGRSGCSRCGRGNGRSVPAGYTARFRRCAGSCGKCSAGKDAAAADKNKGRRSAALSHGRCRSRLAGTESGIAGRKRCVPVGNISAGAASQKRI